jgi:hypothetical protein
LPPAEAVPDEAARSELATMVAVIIGLMVIGGFLSVPSVGALVDLFNERKSMTGECREMCS